ncbi:hypothetical protein HYS94_01835 [Candidatus Daviesbacteria bacterium]|nr:hypothetical protein [Candidatus Daviesbacteria bacterium]
MDGLQIGRIVHYVLWPHETNHGFPEHKAAIITNLFGNDGLANLTVFMDWSNDKKDSPGDAMSGPLCWATSRPYSEEPKPGTWHWPEKV